MNHKQKDNNNYRYSPQGARVLRPALGPPAQESHTGKMSTQNIWLYACLALCTPAGLTYWRAKGLQETEILPLKNVPQILHSPRPDSETVIWKESGSAALLILGSLPERQKQRGLLLGMEKLAAAIHRSLSTAKTLVMMRAIWSSPSSLRALEICPPTTGLKATPGQPRPQRKPH